MRVFWIAVGAANGLVLGWIGWAAIGTYLELPRRETLASVFVLSAVSVPGLLVSTTVFGRSLWRELAAWTARTSTDPRRLLDEVRVAPRRLAVRSSFVVTPAVVAGIILTVGPYVSPLGLVITAIWGIVGIQVVAVTCAVSFDLLMRPVREELTSELSIDPPRGGRGWSIEARLLASATSIAFVSGGLTPAVLSFVDTPDARMVAVLVAATVAAISAMAVFRALGIRPVLRPIADLTDGTERVAAGVFTDRVAVTSDDELGTLAASFNQMQEGLLERERLHTAFGSYVDPALAERLLAQGDELFDGEEVDVTVFFVDVRDFTSYSERAEAREAVSRLNALFGIVVPVLRDHHGHANKFSGDGVLAVFGVPEQILDHAEKAVAAACEIQRQVRHTFGEGLRIGIGINTGRVIAGTVGGGGKLEFALIGDPVNVASRVEQLTKETGDPILLTRATVDALARKPAGLVPRGSHQVKGKTEPIEVCGLDPFAPSAT